MQKTIEQIQKELGCPSECIDRMRRRSGKRKSRDGEPGRRTLIGRNRPSPRAPA
jgi:hypothetical protein